MVTTIALKIVVILIYLTNSHCLLETDFYSYYNLPDVSENMTECKLALANFAEGSSTFTLCSIHYSHPIHVCEMCVDSYMNVVSAHDKIMTLEINGTKCKDKLINVDRLEVVESTFTNINDLWGRGYCDKCFDWIDGKPRLSNQTITFIKYFNVTKECINNHIDHNLLHDNDTDEICTDCMEQYLKLNSYYESLKGTSEIAGICMDIVDSMNATRSVWSDVLNCCRLRKKTETIFLCCTSVVSLLPVLFYLIAKIYCVNLNKIQVTGQHQYDNKEPLPGTSHQDNES